MDAVLYMLKKYKVTTHLSECDTNPWHEETHVPGTSYVAEFFHPEDRRFTGYWWQGIGVKEPPNANQIMRQIFEDLIDVDDHLSFEDWADNFGYEDLDKAQKIYENLEQIKFDLQAFWGNDVYAEIADNLEEGIGDDPLLDLEDGDTDDFVILKSDIGATPSALTGMATALEFPIPLYQKTKRCKVSGKDYGYKRDCTLVVKYGFDMAFAMEHEQAPYFAATADLLPPGWIPGRDIAAGGMMHDEIAKQYPKTIKPLLKWHLVAWPFQPMHYVENGFYWLCKVLGISEWKTERYEHPDRAFRNTVLLGECEGDMLFYARLCDEFGVIIDQETFKIISTDTYETDSVKKMLRDQLKPHFVKWCEGRRDVLEAKFYAEMTAAGLVNPDVIDFSPWIPDGRFYYPCYGYTSDADHDSENEGLMKPYVRVFSEDQGYNDAAKRDPKVSDGFTRPHRTYMAALKIAQRFADEQIRKRALPNGQD